MELTSMSSFLHFFILFILLLAPSISAQFSFVNTQCSRITYPSNSTFQSNLNKVLHDISTNTQITDGFYNFSAGKTKPDKIEAIALCRGDQNVSSCRDCVRSSVTNLPNACPRQTGAFGLSEKCVLFFANTSARRVLQPSWTQTFGQSISPVSGVNRTLYGLLNKLQDEAALGDFRLKYATGNVSIPGNKTIYALAQCTPDLSKSDCLKCFQSIISNFLEHGVTTSNYVDEGARTACPSCNVRYELYKFYGDVEDLSTPLALAPSSNSTNANPQGKKKKKKNSLSTPVIVIIPVLGSLLLLALMALICILWRKKKQRKHHEKFDKEEIETLKSLQFSLGSIKAATEDFSNNNKLGHGGFGTVYKGKLPDGKEVAVKRLSTNSGQGDVQFKNEILTLAKLQHRNLVKLLGFCLDGEEMILIYEFMINKSLDTFLHDPVKRSSVTWETRYKLINGIARGLLYLHEESRLRIIHRDLKAGNVLLDADFNPKIADFGMARLFNMEQTRAVTNKIVGTYGYMPPEYVLHGQLSTKLDVFSFGVLVLEIVSGYTISSFKIDDNPENLLSFAWKNWQQGTPWNLVDPTLPAASNTEILRCIHIGLLCVQHVPAERPNMSTIDLMLNTSTMSLQMPSQPAFFTRGDQNLSNKPDDSSKSRVTINEVSITAPYPR